MVPQVTLHALLLVETFKLSQSCPCHLKSLHGVSSANSPIVKVQSWVEIKQHSVTYFYHICMF